MRGAMKSFVVWHPLSTIQSNGVVRLFLSLPLLNHVIAEPAEHLPDANMIGLEANPVSTTVQGQ
jgi:hypothetical protein